MQTTVYRRADAFGTSPSAVLGKPQGASTLITSLRGEATAAVLDATTENILESDRDQINGALRSATAPELRNIKEAMLIARERDENREGFILKDRASMRALVRTGAHTTLAKAVEHYDEAPEDEALGDFAIKLQAVDLMDRMYRGHTEIAPEGMLSRLQDTSPEDIEYLRRGIDKAIEVDSSGGGGAAMDSIEDSIMGNGTVAYRYGRYADAISSEMLPLRANRMINNLIGSGIIDYETGAGNHLASHLKANRLFEPIAVDRNAEDYFPGKGDSYETSFDLIAGVDMYPDHVEELMEYRKNRQTEDFDTDLFRDYLAAKSPLMQEGML